MEDLQVHRHFFTVKSHSGMSLPAILLINADENCTHWFQRQLCHSHQVFSAPDESQALAMLRHRSFRLVFVVDFPFLSDSISTLKAFRDSLPVVAVCQHAYYETIVQAFRSGADDCLTLPLNATELRAAVERLERRIVRQLIKKGKWLRAGWWLLHAWLAVGTGRQAAALPVELLYPETHLPQTTNTDILSHTPAISAPPPVSPSLHTLRLYLLDGFRLTINEIAIEQMLNRKAKAIFCYLLFHHQKKTARDVLCETFWPHATPESARNCLNVALHSIRQVVKECAPDSEFIRFEKDCYFLNPDVYIWTDAEHFQQHWRTGKALELSAGITQAVPEYEQALALYKGDFLEENQFETWLNWERENFREIYMVMLDRLSRYYMQMQHFEAARQFCEKILHLDSCREDIHRRLMECFHGMGQRDRAVRQFRRCRELLREELEVGPSKATLDLYEAIRNS